MKYRLGELFCGPGGIACGALASRSQDGGSSIEHAWATDYDHDTCETYRKNICPNARHSVIHADIRTLDFEQLSEVSSIDGLAFGFPCNDFSIVGEQRGINGTFGPLYTYGVKALERFRPKWFLAENVGGLRNSNDGKTFTNILKSFFDLGYDVFPHLYKFEDYGVPQARHRIIIVGITKELGLTFKVPSRSPYKSIDNSSRAAIEGIPIPKDATNNELTKQSALVVERLKHIRPGENAFNANIPDSLKLNVKGAKISQIYKRLDPAKPAYTITGSGGGGTHVYHWSEPRALTNRERARLQTFPDTFEFCGSKESVRKQIGMAVPVQGVQVIFNAILDTLRGLDYESEPANLASLVHSKIIALPEIDFYSQFVVSEKKVVYH